MQCFEGGGDNEYIEREQGQLPLGKHSSLRTQLMSDRCLAALGKAAGISSAAHRRQRQRRCRRPSHLARRSGRSLDRSDLPALGQLEAGAGLAAPHWERTSAAVPADPHKGNAKSALSGMEPGPQARAA